ncbi:hypothetical protein [Massilia sp. METH4]|uniref:hypothetical protein n=1 Tax=Massilia sp. METH4 TaxID=3123041 RepID=UPI0030CFE97E
MNKIVPVLILVIVVTMWFLWPINAPTSHSAERGPVPAIAASGATAVMSSSSPIIQRHEHGQPAGNGPRTSE